MCPFFNEEAIIENAIDRMLVNLLGQFPSGSWELILVDDGSEDASLELATNRAAASSARVRVISYSHNQGRGRALKTGIDWATGKIIVTTEVDCSWGDDIVQRLVKTLDENPSVDFVVASVHMRGGGLANVPALRRFLTRFGNWLIRGFFTSKVTMNTGMTRGYRRHVIQPLVTSSNGKEFHLEVLLKLLSLGFRVQEIPAIITWSDEKLTRGGKVRKSSTNILRTITSHLQFIAIAQPVAYFAWMAVASLILGAGFLVGAIHQLIAGGVAAFLAIVALTMFLFALLFVGFSVLFFQLRENSIERWRLEYPRPHPPHVRPGYEAFSNYPSESSITTESGGT